MRRGERFETTELSTVDTTLLLGGVLVGHLGRHGPVFLLGKSGTGKTYIAREIHSRGRLEGNFVILNCGRLPQDTNALTSELLGHVNGVEVRSPFRGLLQGMLALDEEGRVSLCNDSAARLLGLSSPADATGRAASELLDDLTQVIAEADADDDNHAETDGGRVAFVLAGACPATIKVRTERQSG